jgi:hypothetical protein
VKDHLTKTNPASPFLGAAKGPHQPPPKRTTRNKQPKRNKEGKGQQTPSSRTNRWGPTGAVANLAANTTLQVNPRDAQLAALTAQVAALMADPNYGGNFGMPVYPPAHTNATLASSARPRRYYCWLHGWNNSHDGVDCKVMTNDMEYTAQMRNATSEIGSGGNPKIGVPVTYTRPSFFCPPHHSLSCSPCPPSHHPTHSPLSSPASRDSALCPPYDEDIRAHALQTLRPPKSEGLNASRVRDMALHVLPPVTSHKPFPSDPLTLLFGPALSLFYPSTMTISKPRLTLIHPLSPQHHLFHLLPPQHHRYHPLTLLLIVPLTHGPVSS